MLKKCISFIMLVVFSLLVLYPVSATGESPNEIKKQIYDDFSSYRTGSLKQAKEEFDINNIDDVKLGEGQPYYIVSSSFLRSSSDVGQKHSGNDIFELGGYLFPLEENGVSIGNVDVIKENGKWKVFKISTGTDLVNVITQTESLTAQDAKLINDPRFGLLGRMRNEEFIPISLNNNNSVNTQQVDMNSLGNKIIKQYQDNKQLPPDSAGTQLLSFESSQSGAYYYIAAAAIFAVLTIIGIIAYKKKFNA
ncbi:hypothetical protein [Paenibacillus caui]|uniref:hypothetical protein n=1 Tax=Paenibacillus caui TaxID=2873927 RepID=UPI001CA7E5A7|nr:hypothetical protein [Paenibacillus caui]